MQRNLTLPQGTVNQTFCYDDLNRLTWSGSTGTPSCGTSLTAGNLTAATYTQTFSYDTLDRLTSGPNGTYSYSGGSGQPWHAVTSTSNGYKAWYDAAGEMICRAPTTSQTCTSSTQTGQTFTWDAMNRLTAWQNQPTSPTSSDQFAYDGEGKRVWQQSVSGSTTTTTMYFGGYEETNQVTGNAAHTTKYFPCGVVTLVKTDTTTSYLLNDGLGSVSVALDTNGNATATSLYTPYGSTLYTTGSMPTALGFTGQYGDAITGLDYYGARYYDPTVGQFISADTVQGLNRYAYVKGNPETLTDPTGHLGGVGGALAPGFGEAVGIDALDIFGLTTCPEIAVPLLLGSLAFSDSSVSGLGGKSYEDHLLPKASQTALTMGASQAIGAFVSAFVSAIMTVSSVSTLAAQMVATHHIPPPPPYIPTTHPIPTTTPFPISQPIPTTTPFPISQPIPTTTPFPISGIGFPTWMATQAYRPYDPSFTAPTTITGQGKTWGWHFGHHGIFDYGFPSGAAGAEMYNDLARQVFANAQQAYYHPRQGGQWVYINGQDLLILDFDGNALSVYPGAETAISTWLREGVQLWQK